jgi:hypothetical protein
MEFLVREIGEGAPFSCAQGSTTFLVLTETASETMLIRLGYFE